MAEITGLKLFGDYFRDFQGQYVLIGGVASWLTMLEVGEEFRATKDLDIVVIIESLTAEFNHRLWTFIKEGNYRVHQTGEGKPNFYRFMKPETQGFPVQIELFSRSMDGLSLPVDATATPLAMAEGVSSLSAILLDEEYYQFLRSGVRTSRELPIPYINADRLIPFKMKAWLDLTARKSAGEPVDSKVIKKHLNDVLRLAPLMTPGQLTVSDGIRRDMDEFLGNIQETDPRPDPRALSIDASLDELIQLVKESFGLGVEVN